jgi:hypothetical protein
MTLGELINGSAAREWFRLVAGQGEQPRFGVVQIGLHDEQVIPIENPNKGRWAQPRHTNPLSDP